MAEKRYTNCRICEQACGLEVTVEENRILHVGPDKNNLHTWKDFCIKGKRTDKVLYHPRRIQSPMKRVGDIYKPASYDEAVDDIAGKIRRLMDVYGPDSVAFYDGNPATFNGYGLALSMALQKGIGTKNIYSSASIDTNAYFVVVEAMYGLVFSALTPDVDHANCMLLIGTNPAVSKMNWAGNVPNGWKRILEAQKNGACLIVVDPVHTPTARKADLYVAPLPGQDWAFLLGLVKIIFENSWTDKVACNEATGLDKVEAMARSASLKDLSLRCDVPVGTIEKVARLFSQAPTGFSAVRTGVGLTKNGTIGIWLSEILNLITGRIDSKGGMVFNAGIVDVKRKRASGSSPRKKVPSRVRGLLPVIGYRTLCELPDEISTPGQGQVRALFLHSGNPVNTGPDGNTLDDALKKLELLVAVDLVQRESHRHAHWLIPGEHFLEREELNMLLVPFYDQPFVQYSHKVVEPPKTVQPVWKFFADLALALEVPFYGKPAAEVLTPKFHPQDMVKPIVEASGKFTWDSLVNSPHGLIYGKKKYGTFREHLLTPDKRINAHSQKFEDLLKQRLAEKPELPPSTATLQIATRRVMGMMNSWLAETTGISGADFTGDIIEINSRDAASMGISDGMEVEVRSTVANVRAVARVSNHVRPGVGVMEHGWGSRVFDPTGEASPEVYGINRNLLVSNNDLDPIASVPRLNGMPVQVLPVEDKAKD